MGLASAESEAIVRYLGEVIGRAHARQMDPATWRSWISDPAGARFDFFRLWRRWPKSAHARPRTRDALSRAEAPTGCAVRTPNGEGTVVATATYGVAREVARAEKGPSSGSPAV